ncbi:hypothetical protein GCM10010387_20890 [Streptomyces inusitatus]|uniref:Uncharacterized protein n=1 Tax=Streptomyces inusitatus TaxID=68221 RepID=A0A918Q087_9ACTN|nr:hypothetical protein GCM10010387_20890 [Streptomyces inusitatus]
MPLMTPQTPVRIQYRRFPPRSSSRTPPTASITLPAPVRVREYARGSGGRDRQATVERATAHCAAELEGLDPATAQD